MNTEDLRRLAARAEDVEGREADRLGELHARIHRARQVRAGAGAALAAAVVLAVIAGGAALTGTSERTGEPVDRRTPQPTPTGTVEVPAGQVTVHADVGPGDVRGWELRDSVTNARTGATELTRTVETGGLYSPQSYVAPFCNGDPDTWWVLTMDLGGVDGQRNPDGSMQNGSRGMFGTCSPDDPVEVPAPTGDIEPWQWDESAEMYPMRMFVTEPLTVPAQHCLSRTMDTGACLATHRLAPLGESDATFGFAVYEHRQGPTVLALPGMRRFQALAVGDGVEYLVDRAVLAARGAGRLVVRLPASDHRRVVGVAWGETPALTECTESLGHVKPTSPAQEQAQTEEAERRCHTDLELRVDGEVHPPPRHDFLFAEQQYVVPAGDAHLVTVEVVRNDPRNVRYALVIWEER